MNDAPKLLRIPSRFSSVEDVLATAKQLGLPNVLVLAELEDGALVFLESPNMTVASANWLLDRCKAVLLTPSVFERHDK